MSTTTMSRRDRASANEISVEAPRAWKSTIIYIVLAVVALVGFGLLGNAFGKSSTFSIKSPTDFVIIEDFTLPSATIAIICGVICAFIAFLSWRNTMDRAKNPSWIPIVFSVVFLAGFLTWAIAGQRTLPLTGLLAGALFFAVPLIFGSLTGVIGERSGVVNIAIEGQLLGGAFIAALVASSTGNAWIGLIAAPIGGIFVSAILVWFSIKYLVNQIIVGVVINVLVAGLTSYLYSTVMKDNPSLNTPNVLPNWAIPGLSKIPVIGPILFNQNVIVYIMFVVVVVVQLMLFRSRWGLRTRAIGEHPKAADTVGIKVNSKRVANMMIAGVIAGFGGAFFTIGQNLQFTPDMTAGKGFIALAAMIFGRWSPVGAMGAALMFGFADKLQGAFQAAGVPFPSEFMQMIPYIVTIFAVAGLVGKVRGPAAAGEPYVK